MTREMRREMGEVRFHRGHSHSDSRHVRCMRVYNGLYTLARKG